jgi:hypothetical protein
MRKNHYRLLIGIALWLPLVTFAAVGSNSTTATNTTSRGIGPNHAQFVWSTVTVGPATLAIGDLGTCAIPPGPYPNANCPNSYGGSGTVLDPFLYGCTTPLTLSGCTLPGTPFVIALGGMDVDTHTHTQTALVAQAAVATPLDPWVPIGSAIAILLLVLGWRRRTARP